VKICDLASLVDDARQLESDLGLRPYRIFSVYEWWPSGQRGRGDSCCKETEWLPTPMLDFRSLRKRYGAAGSVDSGDVVLRKVSATMTEAQITNLCSCNQTQDPTASVIIEARQDNSCVRRTFLVNGPPYLDAGRFEWIIPLKRAAAIRTRR